MMEVSINRLSRLLKAHYITKQPVMLHGTMGIGKSYAVQELAKQIAEEEKMPYTEQGWDEKSFGFIDIRTALMEPSDLKGVPFRTDNRKYVEYLIERNLFPTKGKGILFFDEANLAEKSVQKAMYGIINDRKVGNYKLGDGWFIIAAGNLETDRGSIIDFGAPLNNRFAHYQVIKPTIEEYTSWAIKNNMESDIIGLLNFKTSLIHAYDPKIKDKAFPTPRTWKKASDVLKTAKEMDMDQKDIKAIISSWVGQGAAIELETFINLKSKVNINELMKNPDMMDNIKDVGQRYAIATTMIDKFCDDPKKNGEKALMVLFKIEPDIAMFALKQIKERGHKIAGFIQGNTKLMNTFRDKFAKLLD